MQPRGFRYASVGGWRPHGAVAPGLLLALAATGALAAPPGIVASDLELVADTTAAQPSQYRERGDRTEADQSASARPSEVADAGVLRDSTASRGEVDAASGDTNRPKGLDSLLAEFLENL